MPFANGIMTIAPEDIVIKGHLWDAFDESESEVSAAWLIEFAQKRGTGWLPFKYADIQAMYVKKFPHGNFHFNNLVHKGWIKQERPGPEADLSCAEELAASNFHFTEDFIARCYRSTTRKQS